MEKLFFILIITALVSVLGALALGIVSLAKGGEFSKKYGNKIMQLRVGLQATALLLFILSFLVK